MATGSCFPVLKNLHRYMDIDSVALNWFAIGMQLGLDNGSLQVIQTNCSGNSTQCFRAMLKKWHEIQPNATEKQLMEALGVIDHKPGNIHVHITLYTCTGAYVRT